jgi:hypothetical protein
MMQPLPQIDKAAHWVPKISAGQVVLSSIDSRSALKKHHQETAVKRHCQNASSHRRILLADTLEASLFSFSRKKISRYSKTP